MNVQTEGYDNNGSLPQLKASIFMQDVSVSSFDHQEKLKARKHHLMNTRKKNAYLGLKYAQADGGRSRSIIGSHDSKTSLYSKGHRISYKMV